MRYFNGKKALVTGGSSGIGKATALLLAQNGADVAIAARNRDKLDAAVAEIRQSCGAATVHTIQVDVADRESVAAGSAEALAKLGGLDILINNAGIAHPGYIQDIPDDIFESMMRVNYFGTVYMTRALLGHFMGQKKGHICNVSSLLGYLGIFGYSAYAASKFAIVGFSDCLRQDVLNHGIKVSVVFPPDTDTPQLHEENRIKPVETKAIAGTVRALKARDVAETMLEGIAAGRYHVIPGMSNKFSYFMYRHFPAIVRYVIDSDLKKAHSRK